jgi:hypothetical protein
VLEYLQYIDGIFTVQCWNIYSTVMLYLQYSDGIFTVQ